MPLGPIGIPVRDALKIGVIVGHDWTVSATKSNLSAELASIGYVMNATDITALLQAAFPQAEIAVSGEGGKFDLRLVDTQFDGLRPVPRQQKVYAVLNPQILSGAIHAVTIRAMTPEEWRKASLFGAG